MSFDKGFFENDVKIHGTEKQCTRNVERYGITSYKDRNNIFGKDWHFRGINKNGDFCYAILDTVEFYLCKRRSYTEYFPDGPSNKIETNKKSCGYMLIFNFVRCDGTSCDFGVNQSIFVNS